MTTEDSDKKIEFYLLGPPKVIYQGQTLEIPRRQVRTLLYLLACQSQPLPYQTLHYIFWSSKPEGFCRRNLSHLFTHVRNVLPDKNLLVQTSISASLDPVRSWSDVIEFIKLTSMPQKVENLSYFMSAHHLYRGALLDGKFLPKSPELEKYIEQKRLNLELLYLKNLYNLIILNKNLRDYSSAIEYAELFLSIDHFNEEILNELLVLHGLMGNQAKAIQTYENFRDRLKEELSIEPSQKNLEFFQRIKNSVPSKIIANLPSEINNDQPNHLLKNFNQSNLKAFQEMMGRKNGSGGIALVIGEIGMGKSEMISHYLNQFNSGEIHFRINCTPATYKIRYYPFRELANQILSAIHQSKFDTNLFTPELNDIVTSLSKPVQIQSVITDDMIEIILERDFSLIQELFQELANLPTEIVISTENIEWIDEDSLELILFLSEKLRTEQIVFICSFCCRKEEKLRVFEENIKVSQANLGILHLDDLTLNDAVGMVEDLFGQFPESERISKQLLQLTGGNPFYFSEILEWMKVNKKSAENIARIQKIEIPLSVKQKILARYERFSSNEKKILQYAAIKGWPLSFEEIMEYINLNHHQTLDVINDLSCRNFLGFKDDKYFIKYEIIRQSIMGSMNSTQKNSIKNSFKATN